MEDVNISRNRGALSDFILSTPAEVKPQGRRRRNSSEASTVGQNDMYILYLLRGHEVYRLRYNQDGQSRKQLENGRQ
jgi:hypothetical protein